MNAAIATRPGFLRENAAFLSASGVLHLALIALLALNLDLLPARSVQPVRLAIQATVVDARALQRREDAEREEIARRAAEVERQRLQAEQEQRAETEQKRSEELRREQQANQQRQADQQRRQDAERKTAEQARAAQQAADRKQTLERQRAADEARRKAETERRQSQARADLSRQLAQEERIAAAAQSGLLDQYAEIIRQKVERNWIRPPSARAGLHCTVNVKQIPGGEVVDVQVSACNGDAAVIGSIEKAVWRSSPLPPPPDPSLFDRSLRFEFKPEE